ncbi:MAG: glycoside hydrolase family 2, partial [Chitinophagaceae bacterium]
MTDNTFAYPRPQLVRESWLSLNGKWKFAFDDDNKFQHLSDAIPWSSEIIVPFPPESEASGIGNRGYHYACWYQREFVIAANGERVLLHFGAVDYHAKVWVNGHLVVEHIGGHTPFSADITHALGTAENHVVTVYAEDDPHDLAKPRGKQDWQLQPHSIWYPRTTGIWQTVWLERVANTYINKIRWTPNFDGFEIGCETMIAGDLNANFTIEVKISHNGKLLADDHYKIIGHEAARKISLSDPGIDDSRNELLWSP